MRYLNTFSTSEIKARHSELFKLYSVGRKLLKDIKEIKTFDAQFYYHIADGKMLFSQAGNCTLVVAVASEIYFSFLKVRSEL